MAWTTLTVANATAGNAILASDHAAAFTNLNQLGGAWTSYTPTWTNVTLGTTGLAQQSAYVNAGKLYIVRLYLKLGTGGALTGAPEWTLPDGVSMNSGYTTISRLGIAVAYDDSATTAYSCHILPSSTTFARMRLQSLNVSGSNITFNNLSSTNPFGAAWAASDIISGQFMFEAA